MNDRVALGRIIGAVALVAGIAALALEAPVLGLIAGILALVGVVVATAQAPAESTAATARPTTATGVATTTADPEIAELRTRIGEVEQTLEDERRQHDTTRQNLAEHLAARPSGDPFKRPLLEQIPLTEADLGSVDPSDIRLLADPETNLFSEAYFRVSLDARIASARRHLRPVAIALVSVIDGDVPETGGSAEPAKVTAAIRQTLRDADTACRLADGSYALILEDTPENGAVWTVERIRRNLNTRHGAHTMWAGVACYPAHAFSTDELLDQATTALSAAREWKQDRIEIATAD